MSASIVRNAAEVYDGRLAEIEAKLEAAKARLASHKQRQVQNPKSWGWAGDLAFVGELLDQVNDFLSGG